MKNFQALIQDCLESVHEIFPWDLQEAIDKQQQLPLLVDIREPYEFEDLHLFLSQLVKYQHER